MNSIGKLAVICFIITLVAGIAGIELLLRLFIPTVEFDTAIYPISLPKIVLFNILVLLASVSTSYRILSSLSYQVALRSHFLGSVMAIGLTTSIYHQEFSCLGRYTCIMSLFHFSEFIVTSIIRPSTLSIDSFLLNHSKAYGLAALASWVEYFIELWLVTGLKEIYIISWIGVFTCLAGEGIRKVAMFTASHNFDHLIRTQREEHHVLVTTGIYSIWRHPSYVGWFYWSIGTQIILCNPLCFITYLITSWSFFNQRVHDEELTLLHFFGDEYVEYQSRVPTGLPFIKGFIL